MNLKIDTLLHEFMDTLLRVVPLDQLPKDLVFPDDEYPKCGNSWYGPTHLIKFHRRSEWRAEQKYKERIEKLEARVKELERIKL